MRRLRETPYLEKQTKAYKEMVKEAERLLSLLKEEETRKESLT